MKIDHINMSVSNLDKSVKFYQDLFHLPLKEVGISQKSGMPYKIIGEQDKFFLCLYQNKIDPGNGRYGHIGVNIENFQQMHERIKELGIQIEYGGIVEYENSNSIYILGPDGEEVELSSTFGGGL